MQKLVDLVRNYKNGDKDALIKIINIFKPSINKYKRNSYCEDMDSELTLFMITLLDRMPIREEYLKDDKYIFSYISKALKNKYIRVNEKHYIKKIDDVPPDDFLNYSEYGSLESNVVFYDIIKDLSDNEKNILNKRYICNLTESDIARELKKSRQYINKVHKRALSKLRETCNNNFIN